MNMDLQNIITHGEIGTILGAKFTPDLMKNKKGLYYYLKLNLRQTSNPDINNIKKLNILRLAASLKKIKNSAGFDSIKKNLLDHTLSQERLYSLLLEINVGSCLIDNGISIEYIDEKIHGKSPDIRGTLKTGEYMYYECYSVVTLENNINKIYDKIIQNLKKKNRKFKELEVNGITCIDLSKIFVPKIILKENEYSKLMDKFDQYINNNLSNTLGVVFQFTRYNKSHISSDNAIKHIFKKGIDYSQYQYWDNKVEVGEHIGFTNLSFH